jgi:hypothetical protein
MKRREFLGNTIAAATLASLGGAAQARAAVQAAESRKREYYEIRAYRFKAEAKHDLLDTFLKEAAIPAWNQLGIKPVGVFTEIDSTAAPVVYVLLPYPSLEVFGLAATRAGADAPYQSSAASDDLLSYLLPPKSNPAFDRIDAWLMVAFSGMPELELPAYSQEKKPRIFEMRTYESFSELKALKKVEMFNSGEIAAMREVGLAPVFYGQALTGPSLPHLTYMLSAENQEVHKQHWAAFNKHPVWLKLNGDPQYKDTVSKITSRFLTPMACSQI